MEHMEPSLTEPSLTNNTNQEPLAPPKTPIIDPNKEVVAFEESIEINNSLLTATTEEIPQPPPIALPPLSSLISKPPSPALPLHLLDLLYSYCLVMRLFNGQYMADPLEAAATVLDSSAVLGAGAGATGGGKQQEASSGHLARSVPTAATSPSIVLLDCVIHVCGSEARSSHAPRSFAIGILSDVAHVLELGRSVVVTALMDLSRILDAGVSEARTARIKQNTEMVVKLKQAHKKLLFFLSWANEGAEEVCPGLAAAAAVVYRQQRETLGDNNRQGAEGLRNNILIKE